jgi:hypothetical protein
MSQLTLAMTRLYLTLVLPPERRDQRDERNPHDERGDVPGWVLITVMTAGLVMAIWGVAKGELTAMLRDALNSVHN